LGARRLIRSHLITGLALVLVVAGGFGGWASIVLISGALNAPGPWSSIPMSWCST
jgi:HlyD family secretion protein